MNWPRSLRGASSASPSRPSRPRVDVDLTEQDSVQEDVSPGFALPQAEFSRRERTRHSTADFVEQDEASQWGLQDYQPSLDAQMPQSPAPHSSRAGPPSRRIPSSSSSSSLSSFPTRRRPASEQAVALSEYPPWSYSKWLELGGLPALVDVAFAQEKIRGHPLTITYSQGDWREYGVELLASIPDKVLKGILEGNLAENLHGGDVELQEVYGDPKDELYTTAWEQRASNPNEFAPGLYVRHIVDKHGRAPTPAQMLKVIAKIQEYISDAPQYQEYANSIDHQILRRKRKPSKRGNAPKYFLTSMKSGRLSRTRISQIQKFCKAVKARLDNVRPEDMHNPSKHPWVYVGYAKDFKARQKGHERGTSFLSGLVLEIFTYEFPGQFSMMPFVVAFVCNSEEAKLGEVILTEIARAHFESGIGLCVHPAGQSNISAELKNETTEKANEIWKIAQRFRENQTPYLKKMHQLAEDIETGEIAKRNDELQDSIREYYEAQAIESGNRLSDFNAEAVRLRLSDEDRSKIPKSALERHDQLLHELDEAFKEAYDALEGHASDESY